MGKAKKAKSKEEKARKAKSKEEKAKKEKADEDKKAETKKKELEKELETVEGQLSLGGDITEANLKDPKFQEALIKALAHATGTSPDEFKLQPQESKNNKKSSNTSTDTPKKLSSSKPKANKVHSKVKKVTAEKRVVGKKG